MSCFVRDFSKNLINIANHNNEEEILLLNLRVKTNLTTICEYHKMKYLNKFNHLFGQTCCDPLNKHKNIVKKGLREIKMYHLSKPMNLVLELTPGKSLCPTCYKNIFIIQQPNNLLSDITESHDDSFVPENSNLERVDMVFKAFDLSPVSKIKRLNPQKRSLAIQKKN